LVGQTVASSPKGVDLKKGAVLTGAELDAIEKRGLWRQIGVEDEAMMAEIEAIGKSIDAAVDDVKARFDDKVEKLQRGDELSPGVMKMVKVFVAIKRKIQPGDKMAGRHGNKGVVSRIMKREDMPYLADGTPVDVVLNPLGVPSRMNVGQILETHLGWATATLGRQIGDLIDSFHNPKHPAAADMDKLKAKLKDVYGDGEYQDKVMLLNDDQIVEMSNNLRGGVPMATPVFDGAGESRVKFIRSGDID